MTRPACSRFVLGACRIRKHNARNSKGLRNGDDRSVYGERNVTAKKSGKFYASLHAGARVLHARPRNPEVVYDLWIPGSRRRGAPRNDGATLWRAFARGHPGQREIG